MDTQPALNLEVIVPRILLPSLYERQTAIEEQASEHLDAELVKLIPIITGSKPVSSSKQDQQAQLGELSTYTARHGLFHLFRIERILIQGPAYLLQVLRRGKAGSRTQHKPGKTSEPYRVTDELAFTLKFCYGTGDEVAEIAQATLIPGWNQIVIVLDAENIPTNYTIDGSER